MPLYLCHIYYPYKEACVRVYDRETEWRVMGQQIQHLQDAADLSM